MWALEEFGELEAPDARLKARVTRMANTASQYGGGRISEVFRDPAERQGAYDLLEGGRISGEALGAAMASACVARSAKESFVFVPLDGSSISVVDRRQQTDLGVVGAYRRKGRGLQVVTSAGGFRRRDDPRSLRADVVDPTDGAAKTRAVEVPARARARVALLRRHDPGRVAPL